MKLTRPCPWCSEQNDVPLDNRKLYCWSCAHRADVPKLQCDCRRCRRKPMVRVRNAEDGRFLKSVEAA
jgi:hypothetical protein